MFSCEFKRFINFKGFLMMAIKKFYNDETKKVPQ